MNFSAPCRNQLARGGHVILDQSSVAVILKTNDFARFMYFMFHVSCIYLKKYKVYKTSYPANSYNANLGRTRL